MRVADIALAAWCACRCLHHAAFDGAAPSGSAAGAGAVDVPSTTARSAHMALLLAAADVCAARAGQCDVLQLSKLAAVYEQARWVLEPAACSWAECSCCHCCLIEAFVVVPTVHNRAISDEYFSVVCFNTIIPACAVLSV